LETCPVTFSRDDAGPDRRRLYTLLGVAGVLFIPVAVFWWPGCRQYPPVSSPESLTLMRRLYTACNTRDPQRLAGVEQRLAELEQDGKVTPEEKAGFERIIGMARAGDWEDAEKAAFKFAQDQVGQGDDQADSHDDHEHHKHPHPKKGKGK
jgi:hypothetical protein